MPIVNIQIGEKYFTKDPQSTELGRNIISESIVMLEDLGFEDFTFKKLAGKIGSTEASVYRYFENKLKLLVYLTSWYWAWMEYVIDYQTHFIENKDQKLREIIKILCHADKGHLTLSLPGIDIAALKQVVVSESDKTYLTKKVDQINNEGLFKGFKGLCHKIALVVIDIDPRYEYPHAIVSTIIEASHQQPFFALHLPALTEIKKGENERIETQVYRFIEQLIFRLLR